MSLSAKKEVSAGAEKKRTEDIQREAMAAAKKVGTVAATREWVDAHDELLDKTPDGGPITVDVLLSDKLIHKTFPNAQKGGQATAFDWTEFRHALEERDASSPRWFVQLREEDLLLGPHGLDGVTVDCFVVAEAKAPTLSPAEYIVKVHWPYSDAEDNAPERILSIAGQKMCWRRVVKADGSDINVYLLQRRSDSTGPADSVASSASFGFGLSSSSSPNASTTSVPSAPGGFSFGGAVPAAAPAPSAASAPSAGFGFGFGAQPAAPASTGFGFGFGGQTAAPAPAAQPMAFGFGAPAQSAGGIAFGFGSAPASAPAASSDAAAPSCPQDNPAVATKPLKPSELLFTLWSEARLEEMVQDIRSGSRIVRERFQLDANTVMKLVMQNDVEDEVPSTARRLLLTRLFAKQDPDVKTMDKWIDDCPVYDEELAPALQEFRERRLLELAEESDEFENMVQRYQSKIEAELARIVAIRRQSMQLELEMIEKVRERIRQGVLLEKKHFRLLKYYAKNDILPFRPFGKISGISEMGEAVDVCVPPAHVNINPFLNNK